MKAFAVALALLFSPLVFAHEGHEHKPLHHLTFAGGKIHAHVQWEVGPQVFQESLLRIEWLSGVDHSPTEVPEGFDVELWMPAMGHGSAPTQIQRVIDSSGNILLGVYRVSNVYFTMGGDWEIKVSLREPGGQREVKTIELTLEGDGHHH